MLWAAAVSQIVPAHRCRSLVLKIKFSARLTLFKYSREGLIPYQKNHVLHSTFRVVNRHRQYSSRFACWRLGVTFPGAEFFRGRCCSSHVLHVRRGPRRECCSCLAVAFYADVVFLTTHLPCHCITSALLCSHIHEHRVSRGSLLQLKPHSSRKRVAGTEA